MLKLTSGLTAPLTSPVAQDLAKAFARTQGGGVPGATMRAVANRVSMPQSQNSATTNERAISSHVLDSDVNGQIEVSWANFRVNSGVEIVAGAAIANGSGQVTYVDRVSGNPVTVPLVNVLNSSTVLTAPDGGVMKCRATIDALAGTKIKLEERDTNSAGAIYTQFKSDLAGGDRFEFSASPVGALGSPGIQTFETTYRGPSLITALSAKPVAGIIGDSRTGDGIYDVPNTARGDGGLLPRILGRAGVSYVNLSSRGDKAKLFVANSTRRKALAVEGGVTYIILACAINDLAEPRTAEQVIADNEAIINYFGLPAVWLTCDPYTTDGIDTPRVPANEAQRQIYNAYVRSRAAYIDTDVVLGTPSGGWRNEDAVYSDYLHHLNIGGEYAAQHAAFVGTTLAQHGLAPRAAGPVMPGKGTNLLPSSRTTNNASWTKVNGTIATLQKDPQFGGTAEAFLETVTNGKHQLVATNPISFSTGTYEIEIDCAYLGYQWVQLELGGLNCFIALDVQNGAIGQTYAVTPSAAQFTGGTVQDLGNGYRRFKLTAVINGGPTNAYINFGLTTGNLSGSDHVGDVNKGLLLRPCFYIRKVA